MANTTFSTLKINALKMAGHPTTDATAKDRMGLFINQAIQHIASMDEAKRLVQDYGSINTVANQEYVELSNLTGTKFSGYSMNEINSVYQTSDDIWLNRWTMQEYREYFPDVSTNSGNPEAYARWAERLYLYPRPSSVIALNVDFWIIPATLSADGDRCDFIPKYDEWVLAGAVLGWLKTYEGNDPIVYPRWKAEFNEMTLRFGIELSREPDRRPVARSHTQRGLSRYPYARPVHQ